MTTPTLREAAMAALKALSVVTSTLMRPEKHMKVVRDLRLALTAPEQSPADAPAAPTSGEPVATLHDDGCFTWKRDEFRRLYDRQRAGWHMDVYATPPSAAQAEGAKRDELVASIKSTAEHWAYMAEIDNGDAANVARRKHAEKVDQLAALTAAPEKLAPAPQQAGQENDEFETRADGKRVRKDRWQWGIRRIVALLWGNRHEFEVDEVVEAVRKLLPTPFANGEDEALVDSVGRGFTPPSPQQAAQGGERDSEWVLAIGHALGLDSGFKVPIVPRVEPFRELFAAVRARAAQGERAGVGLTDERAAELLRWAYSKLVYRSFASMEDALAMDEIKLMLMGAPGHGIVTTEGGGE